MGESDLPLNMGEHLSQVIPDYNRRIAWLERTEWQRWIPALSVYRSLTEDFYDGLILSLKHSSTCNFANAAYNLAQIVAIGCGAAVLVGNLGNIAEKLF